ncbi:unnamed protein product [Amoebophrya sp. A25]|nr:unnamed protein product [Amoebophrya sp. A25]|eukprot:GSA25T00014726001.1
MSNQTAVYVTYAKRVAAQKRLPSKPVQGKISVFKKTDERGQNYVLKASKPFRSRDGTERKELWLSTRALGQDRALKCIRFAAKGTNEYEKVAKWCNETKHDAATVYDDEAESFLDPQAEGLGGSKKTAAAKTTTAKQQPKKKPQDNKKKDKKAPFQHSLEDGPLADDSQTGNATALDGAIQASGLGGSSNIDEQPALEAESQIKTGDLLDDDPFGHDPFGHDPFGGDPIAESVADVLQRDLGDGEIVARDNGTLPDCLLVDLPSMDIDVEDFRKEQMREFQKKKARSVVVAGGLCTKFILEDETEPRQVILVPTKYRTQIIKHFHEDVLDGCHSGRKETLAKVRRNFTWVGCARQARAFVRACRVCAQAKVRRGLVTFPQKFSVTTMPLQVWEIDFVGPLQPSGKAGFCYVFTIIDLLSGWVVLEPTITKEAAEVAEVLHARVICTYGRFHTLRSDRGSEFIAAVMVALASIFAHKHIKGCAYNPTSQSEAERMRRVLSDFLRAYIIDNLSRRANWALLIPAAAWAFRTHPQSGKLGRSLFELVHGFRPATLVNLPKVASPDFFHQFWVKRLDDMREIQEETAEKQQEVQEAYADATAAPKVKIGDIVYVRLEKLRAGITYRLQALASGPFDVIDVYGSAVLLKHQIDSTSFKCNIKRIIPIEDYAYES